MHLNRQGRPLGIENRDLDRQGRPLGIENRDMYRQGRALGIDNRDLDRHGRALGIENRDLDRQGRDMYRQGRALGIDNRDLDRHGRALGIENRDLDRQGRSLQIGTWIVRAGLLELKIGTWIVRAGLLELRIGTCIVRVGLLELIIGTWIVTVGLLELRIGTWIVREAIRPNTHVRDRYEQHPRTPEPTLGQDERTNGNEQTRTPNRADLGNGEESVQMLAAALLGLRTKRPISQVEWKWLRLRHSEKRFASSPWADLRKVTERQVIQGLGISRVHCIELLVNMEEVSRLAPRASRIARGHGFILRLHGSPDQVMKDGVCDPNKLSGLRQLGCQLGEDLRNIVKTFSRQTDSVQDESWIFQGLISTLQLVKKLDRYPFRKKRKIDSVEQEETTMNIKKEATNQGAEDPHNWLKKYERVAKHNQWDETLCLANVYFYLTGTALKWFENNEESILTWKEFMSQLKSVFGKNENLRLRAEKPLKTRAQLKGESTEFYIQDVLRLCKEVLLPRDAHTTEQFVTECRLIEALHCKRVTATRYKRLPNVASLSDHDDRADLSSMIRQMVREEEQRALASPRKEPEISAIEHMVQQEIEKTIAPISNSFPQNRAPRPLPSPRYEFQPRNFQPRPQQPKQVNGRRDTNEWRTTEGKPICFHCGRPGHVVRYCRDRRREYEGEQTWNYKQRDKQEPRTFYNSRSNQDPNDDLPRENIRRYRSPSPYTGRKGQHSSPDRRPSQSPRRSQCRKELLLERELTAPSSVISLTNDRGKLWVVNWSPYPKLIPQGMHVADSVVIEDSQLCTLAYCNQVETEAEHSEDPKISEFFIDDSLDEYQKEKLRNMLKNYTDIFEFSKRKNSRTSMLNTELTLETTYRPNKDLTELHQENAKLFRMSYLRTNDNLLKGLKWTICLCYLDDIIVFSDDFEEHLRRLQLVLNCLKKAGLFLNSKKCKFGAKTITVLGHEKDSAFNWNQEEQNAFEALKSALIFEPALGHFDCSSPTKIHTDASNYGIGAVLVHIQKGKERAIAYASRTLNKAEKNIQPQKGNALPSFGLSINSDHMSLDSHSLLLARWALRLQEIDVTVVYKSGRKHQDADCLSISPLKYSEDMEEDIPCIELLKNFHDSPTAGHLGFTKTYDRIRKRYYWPGMYRTVRRYVAHCSDCQRRKHQPQLLSGHLQPIPVPEVAFEKVRMDLLGRFPTSEGGNCWIIVCTDYLTKYAITKALPTSESMEVAKFFIEDVILKHGAPRELITDRGRNFTSSMISDLNNQCRITHRKTTAYHLQTNGPTERLNKTIADMLSMYVDVNQKDWDRILPFVTFAYNTAKQESTGFTPFFLVHGREAETPLDVLFPKLLPEDDDFIQTLGARAEEARKLARIHSMRSQDSKKHRYDAHHRNIIYQPGDLVWIFIPVRKVGYSEKLMRRYFGPYKVIRKISDVTYEVETFGNQQGRRKTKYLVHICRLNPYLNPEDQEDHLEEDPEDDSTNFQEEDIPTGRTQQPQTREEISGPITRSQALRLRM
ncbi:K02A2.6-like [Cordylochernes scorpioides]|uniref:RNA-directed DNA polymerase n=1 Tax=Cordylochernes scorpioides TaxID=51811 RepID=A0ABY6L9U1_9ARAC|nr:K02A2.6-like [Cordylochernes scorpioides]